MKPCSLALLVILTIVGCGDDPDLPQTKPSPTSTNDPAFSVIGVKPWYLIPDAVTPGDTKLTVAVTAPAQTAAIDVWLGDLAPVRMWRQDDQWVAEVSLASLPAGDFDLMLNADAASTAFYTLRVHHSAPYYFLMSTDWDFAEVGANSMSFMNALRTAHPTMRITHFIGPYTYTDTTMTAQRKAEITAWLLEQRDRHKDELGLHIHPYCNFVDQAGVGCITDQSTVYPTDTTGYTIKCSAYGETDFGKLLVKADEIFAANQLGKPVTFRAGGWTADATTLKALAAHGYVADTSANNWARMEEWQGIQNGELYRWNMANWAPIGDTSQPYYPSNQNAALPGTETIDILEVPDNGIMVDYVSIDEMKEISAKNWDGNALTAPKTLMVGYHPSANTSKSDTDRVKGIMAYADEHLASQGRGPIVYAVLKDMPKVFPK